MVEPNCKHTWPRGRRRPLLLALALFSLGLRAHALPCSRQTVPVSVTDPDGRLVLGLTTSDFLARFRGRPAAILNARMDASPRRIVLLLDASGSMLDPDTQTWTLTLAVAKDLVETLPPEHLVALFVFANQVDRKIDFTRDRKPILQQLDDLRAGRRAFANGLRATALWDTVLEALSLFGSPRIGDTIYAITDGDDNQSRAGPDKVKKALLTGGVRFFAVLPPRSDAHPRRSPQIVEGPINLHEVAETTGGSLLKPYTIWASGDAVLLGPAQLRVALDRLYRWMVEFYRLEIELPQPIDKIRDWKLEVLAPVHRGKVHLELAYPHKLVPCE